MAYYTDQDRQRAAAARKRNQMRRQMRETPEDIYDIWGIKVPKVSNEPNLSEYGLPDDIEERLKRTDAISVASRKEKRSIIAWCITIGAFFLSLWLGASTRDVSSGVVLFVVAGFYPLAMLWAWARDDKPEQTATHTRYEQYKTQLRYYQYWQRKKDKNHWNKMSGHAFEQAVANLFRTIGFTAQVSRRGGDGGIDIILQKHDRRIAVQCKRYKSAVGPHVIRDLWGTMHNLGYDEGCIVTTTGFTKGVKDFAQDKKIYLIDLNDILRTTNEGESSAYLRRKIGEQV